MSSQIVASLGLISDTHYQDRLFELPTGMGNLWGQIDLILHAGDVGELDVLDLLGQFAPTVAVHGNDEPDHVKQKLPCQQLIAVHGLRILLWHSHYPDPVEEKANRKGLWGPKLKRIAEQGRAVGAQVVVYGHMHVLMIYRHKGVLLVNPGALASGSYFTRQKIKSVARLQLFANGEVDITHLDVATSQPHVLNAVDPKEDVDLLIDRYQEWIVEPDLIPAINQIKKMVFEDMRAVVRATVPLYKRCLSDGPMRREDLISAIRSNNLVTPSDKKNILATIDQLA